MSGLWHRPDAGATNPDKLNGRGMRRAPPLARSGAPGRAPHTGLVLGLVIVTENVKVSPGSPSRNEGVIDTVGGCTVPHDDT